MTKKELAKKMLKTKGKQSLLRAKGERNEGDVMTLGRKGNEQARA